MDTMLEPPTDSALAPFEQLVHDHFGLRCDDSLRERLRSAVARHSHGAGGSSATSRWEHYYRRLSQAREEELLQLAQDLSIGESYFFREPNHFRALSESVLPELLRSRAATRRLRLLSAGCAAGEEAYTLALTLAAALQEHPEAADWDIEILGADLNETFLHKARRAEYSRWALRALPSAVLERHFRHHGELHQFLRPAWPSVRFERHNLYAADSKLLLPQRFDVIFCRNVLLYFTADAMSRLAERFAKALTPGGYLFLGHAETLRGLSCDFHLCHTHETFYYRVRDDNEPRSEALPWPAPTLPDATPALAATLDTSVADASWIDAILHATQRIAALSSGLHTAAAEPIAPPAAAPLPAAPAKTTLAAPGGAAPTAERSAQALELFRTERYAEAIQLLRQDPLPITDGTARILLASALTQHGEIAAASELCSAILAADELNPEATYLLAACREHSGALQEALQHAEAAAYLDAQFAMPHLLLGRLARRAGDRKRAQREFGRALDLFMRENATRTLLFGGGFTREALAQLCRAEQAACQTETP